MGYSLLTLLALAPAWAGSVPKVPSVSALAPVSPPPLRLVIMGPPASGKGTYAQRLAADYGLVHVSAGDLLRERARTDAATAETMRRGDLVPVELVVSLVAERIARPDVKAQGFVIDGFPRRLAEAKAFRQLLERQGESIDAAIRLDAPEDVLLSRVLRRGRADDTEPTFRNRMKVYRRQTVPAMRSVARGTTLLRPRLTGKETIDQAYAKVKALVETLRSKPLL